MATQIKAKANPVGTLQEQMAAGNLYNTQTGEKINYNTVEESVDSDMITTIQDKLLEQTGLVSSQNAEIEKGIGSAISSIKSGAEAGTKAIESAYSRERAFAEGQAESSIQSQLEGRSGFATQMVAFRNLVDTTDKNLKDLAMRKEELILQNNAQAANQISQLEVQSLQFKQQATQNLFSNLLSMGNLAMSQRSEQRLARQQSFAEQQAINSIALQYGVTVQPGDTLDSITTRVAPYASEEQRLSIAKVRAEINRANAETARALKDAKVTSYDSTTVSSLAKTAFVLSKDPSKKGEYENIIGAITEGGDKALTQFYEETLRLQKAELDSSIVESVTRQTTSSSLPKLSEELIGGFINTIGGISSFITSKPTTNVYNPKTGKIERRK